MSTATLEQTLDQVDKRFVRNQQGKEYVMYAGLLDLAHRRGLRRIVTHPIQLPHKDNGLLAVVKAVVEMASGLITTGVGDASPENVGRMIIPHALRMAETRAKARALRDALNVGGTAWEELGGPEMSEEDQRLLLEDIDPSDAGPPTRGGQADQHAPSPKDGADVRLRLAAALWPGKVITGGPDDLDRQVHEGIAKAAASGAGTVPMADDQRSALVAAQTYFAGHGCALLFPSGMTWGGADALIGALRRAKEAIKAEQVGR